MLQEGVLGSLLYVLYTLDLQMIQNTSTGIFSDDTAILSYEKNSIITIRMLEDYTKVHHA